MWHPAKRRLHFEQRVGRSWRADETYVKVQGGWMFLYRAVDERGKTVESYLSRTRDVAAAKAFFRKALKHHGEPRSITLDAFKPSHAALRRMGLRNEFNFMWDNPVKIRSSKYLKYCGTRSSSHQIADSADARFQEVLQRQTRLDWG